MMPVTLERLASIVGGTVVRGGDVLVDGPVVVDSRRAEPGSLFLAMAGEQVDGHDFATVAREAGAVATLGSRPVDGPCVTVANPMAAVTALARWSLAQIREHGDTTVVAITGSQGKTSVKDLAAHVLGCDGETVAAEGSFNNELGVPLTILRATTSTRWLVLEMGARGIGHIRHLCQIATPDVAAVLNVGTAHLGEFGGVEGIAEAKGEIVEGLDTHQVAVLNMDDPRVAEMRSRTHARIIGFGSQDTDISLGSVVLNDRGHPQFTVRHGGETFDVSVPQVGYHHAVNAVAAFAICRAVGLEPSTIVASLATAQARSPMRMERIVTEGGLTILNDAYNANPESMTAALRTLAAVAPGRSIAVLGPMLELGEASAALHRSVGELADQLQIDHVIAVGAEAAPIAAGAGERAVLADDVHVAIGTLSASLRPGDTVLVKASRGVRLERIVEALLA